MALLVAAFVLLAAAPAAADDSVKNSGSGFGAQVGGSTGAVAALSPGAGAPAVARVGPVSAAAGTVGASRIELSLE